jgi:hypothetical protein
LKSQKGEYMKSKIEHTPGPWYIHKDYYDNPTGKNHQIMYKSGDAQHTSLCRVIQNPGDAHLIAAAPDLLAALERVLECHRLKISLDTNAAALEQARAAIRKAKGE